MTARTSRRDLFGGGASLMLLTAAAAGTAKAQELDGELIARCAELAAIDQEDERLWNAAPDDVPRDHPAWLEWEAYSDAAMPRWHKLVREIVAMPARTPEGLRAKAATARRAIVEDRREQPDPADRLVWSVLADLLGRAGA